MATRLPKPQDVSRILQGLLGKDPAVTQSKVPFKVAPKAPILIGEFLTPDKQLAVLLVSDLEFACRAGAALAMMPSGVVDNSIKAGKMDPALAENYYEVANVLTAAFAAVDTRLVLRGVLTDATKLAPDGQAILKKPAARLDLEANLPVYGKGKFALLAA